MGQHDPSGHLTSIEQKIDRCIGKYSDPKRMGRLLNAPVLPSTPDPIAGHWKMGSGLANTPVGTGRTAASTWVDVMEKMSAAKRALE